MKGLVAAAVDPPRRCNGAVAVGLALPLVLFGCGSSVTNPSATDGGADTGGAGDAGADAGTDTGAGTDGGPGADAGTGDQDASTGDAGDGVTTWTPDASSPATPIDTPLETWTWVPFPDSACANGTPAGIGINLTHRSSRLLIYMQGGGACWDGATCYLLRTASHIGDTYDAAMFQTEIRGSGGAAVFDRTNMHNPFRDVSWVYVPYCTGDIHGGNRIATYESGGTDHVTYHVGFQNMTAYLRRLALTFPMADRVWLSGASAGGFGAGINWDHTQNAFPMARVDLIDDSGPPFTPPPARWSVFRDAWNIQWPSGCPQCADGLTNLLTYYATRFPPPHRMALLSYTRDATISTYFAIDQSTFEMDLNNMARTGLDPYPAARYFFVAGSTHTMLGQADTVTGADGTVLLNWLGQMATDDPAWHSVHP